MNSPIISCMRRLVICIIPFSLGLTGCTSSLRVEKDISRYEEFLMEARDNSDFHTELYLFPDHDEIGTSNQLVYAKEDGLFSGSYFFYLSLTLSEESYEAEIARIASLKATFKNGHEKPIFHAKDHHCYLSIEQSGKTEFAHYDEATHRIAYLSNQFFKLSQFGIAQEDQIEEFAIPNEWSDPWESNTYNMYYWYVGDIGTYVKD